MAGVNKAFILGRLGKDPEVKTTPSGAKIANFSVATSEKYKDKQGNSQEKTEWHNLVAFGKTADLIGQYLKKGSQAYFEGKLQTRSWNDRDGNKRYTTEIVVVSMQFVGGVNNGGQQQQQYQSAPQQQYQQPQQQYQQPPQNQQYQEPQYAEDQGLPF